MLGKVFPGPVRFGPVAACFERERRQAMEQGIVGWGTEGVQLASDVLRLAVIKNGPEEAMG